MSPRAQMHDEDLEMVKVNDQSLTERRSEEALKREMYHVCLVQIGGMNGISF